MRKNPASSSHGPWGWYCSYVTRRPLPEREVVSYAPESSDFGFWMVSGLGFRV